MPEIVLLIARDREITRATTAVCEELETQLVHVAGLDQAGEHFSDELPGLVLCDYATFTEVREKWPQTCVLLYADPAHSDEAIEAIKHGALDYVVQPIVRETLLRQVQDALRVSRDIQIPAVYEDDDDGAAVDRIVGQSPAMKELYKLIGLVAPRDINVLITGESGTGKELVARALLHHSLRKDRPYLAANCAAIPGALLESELFGHEKGAFTGADQRRIGRFEQVTGGTLFLDEIGDIPLATQAKLLRVLQDGSFQRLGGGDLIRCDVRIIAATHQPLEQLIEERRFRQDLYYRLNVASIDVPPLREREVDVVLLAHYFVERFGRTFGADIRYFSPQALPILLKYPWPGNVRELENAIKSALVVARGTVLQPEFLPKHIRVAADTVTPGNSLKAEPATDVMRAWLEDLATRPELAGSLHRAAIDMAEREIICICLEQTHGRLALTAEVLGISRTTLRKKMAEFGIQTKVSVDRAT